MAAEQFVAVSPDYGSSTTVWFDCDSDFLKWESAWSDDKKRWCCAVRSCESSGSAGAVPAAEVAAAALGGALSGGATESQADAWELPEESPIEVGPEVHPPKGSPFAAGPEVQGFKNTFTTGQNTLTTPRPTTSAKKLEQGSMGCAWPGDDCSEARCCNMAGAQCFRKTEYYSGCRDSCKQGQADENGDGEWSCERLGGSREILELPAAGPSEGSIGTSLFCFVGALMDDEEGQLVHAAEGLGAHIFACDAHTVYETEHTGTGEWQSFTNTDVFIKIWKQVHTDGVYRDHDWTVKVDPDAVFLPDRLRQHLEGLRAPAGASVYVKNCDFKFGFMGSLEILSKQAVEDYAREVDTCNDHLGHDGGEDFYLKSCLDAIGVGHMVDDTVLDDKYTYDHDYDLSDLSFCGSGAAAAYHPIKMPDEWHACYDMAIR